MMADRLTFALWGASLHESDVLVLRRCGRLIELRLRCGNASVRSIILRKRE